VAFDKTAFTVNHTLVADVAAFINDNYFGDDAPPDPRAINLIAEVDNRYLYSSHLSSISESESDYIISNRPPML
jgi:hypothetical protein